MYVIVPQIDATGYDDVNYSDAEVVGEEYTSASGENLSKDGIVDLLESTKYVPEV